MSIAGLAVILFTAAAGLAGGWRRQPHGRDRVPWTPPEPVPDGGDDYDINSALPGF
jgi:hypothetical protein